MAQQLREDPAPGGVEQGMTVKTYPVAAACYPSKGATLTHAVDETGRPLCGRVKADSILDDDLWGDLASRPTCPTCAKRDPRFRG